MICLAVIVSAVCSVTDGVLQTVASELTVASSPRVRRQERLAERRARKEAEQFHASLAVLRWP